MINKYFTFKKCIQYGILICSVLLYSCIYPEDAKVRQGNRKYNNKNYSEASKKFKSALKKDPGNFNANFNLANSLINQGKYSKSDSILSIMPDTSLSKQQLSDLYFNKGTSMLRHYILNDSLIKIIDNQPKSIRNYIMKDSLSKEMNNLLSQSISSYKNTLRNAPKDEDARYNLSYANRLKTVGGNTSNKDKKKEKMKPSEFAKRIKAHADSLNNELLFTNAFQTMLYGASIDSTVKSYAKYVKKIKDVIDIDTIQ